MFNKECTVNELNGGVESCGLGAHWCRNSKGSKYKLIGSNERYLGHYKQTLSECYNQNSILYIVHPFGLLPGDGKSEKLAVLFEQWASAKECWKDSALVLRARQSTSFRKRGQRRWMTESQIKAMYDGCAATAREICELKENDEQLCKTQIKNNPNAPSRRDLRLYLVFDQEIEVDEEEDLVVKELVEKTDRKKDKKKEKKGGRKNKDKKPKKKKTKAVTSSSESSSQSDVSSSVSVSSGSSDSSSSTSVKPVKVKKEKKNKKQKKDKKEDKKDDKKKTEKEEEEERKKKEKEEEKRQKEEERKRKREEEQERKKQEREEKQKIEKEKNEKRGKGKKAWGLDIVIRWTD